ncbi:DUF4440 domain-containing protein [Flavobacterium foetidum]|uniref:DUF4440 domain-containing protein n=1 Tax=Flavobacterium foetidum TaxID=2026681 RepID=UPI0010755A5F|nr:DUF4440 domain-containing protein [Flavobacterium foetidum]KAF2510548.1 DUF4440 domain-containing protein [Flavobacterium foetidum]
METKIIELEKKYWQGMKNHEYETVKNLTNFPCIIAGKNGIRTVDEANFKKMFESGEGDKIKVESFSDFKFQQLSEESAVTAYVIQLLDTKENKSMKCACTSAWMKQKEQWTCVLHTETELSAQ